MTQSQPLPIVIVGSLNMDFIAQIQHLPARGETVPGRSLQTLPGGKGANQAFTVGRLGGLGKMIGCVGDDLLGKKLKANLESVGIDVEDVEIISGQSTGVAIIEVEHSGQNTIVVISGANTALQPEAVQTALKKFQQGFLLLQLETPMKTVEAAAKGAKESGMTVILDPAPAQFLSAEFLCNVDILTPNESEALALLNLSGDSISLEEAPEIARKILSLGPQQVILKLGEKGAFWANTNSEQYFPGCKVDAVDATAAGDCFNGALAVTLAEGKNISEAIQFANYAASIAVTRVGAQASIPSREEVEFRSRTIVAPDK